VFRSIRWRLVTSYVVLTLLTVGAVGSLSLWVVKRYADQKEVDYLTANARAIASQALPLMYPQVSTYQLSQLAQVASFFGNVQVRILDATGRQLADSGLPEHAAELAWFMLPAEVEQIPGGWIIGPLPSQTPLLQSRQEGLPFSWIDRLPPGTSLTIISRTFTPWGSHFSFRAGQIYSQGSTLEEMPGESTASQRSERVIRVPIGDEAQPLGFVELSAGTDFGAEALAATRRAFVLAGSGAVILAAMLGLLMGNRLTTPIARLKETTRRMSSGDLSVRAPVHGSDEIGELAIQFNSMAEQLQASFNQVAAERDSLRRFIADASHELRTPITALKNFNDLLLSSAAEDQDVRIEFLTESQVQIDRLAWITNNLLDLSRFDAGLASMDIETHDLQRLIESALASYRPRIAERNINLVVNLPEESLGVHCDAGRFETVVSNLIDNALKFTPAGGEIEIGAAATETSTEIWIQDTGSGIDPEDLPHVFERFYRGRSNHAPGSGLGLSIAQSILQAHGGYIRAENVPGSGARFTLGLPK